jgi:hypothetical protein
VDLDSGDRSRRQPHSGHPPIKSYPKSYPHAKHAPRRIRPTSRTKRRGTVNTDHTTSQTAPNNTVSKISPLQIGRKGIGTGARFALGVTTANELPDGTAIRPLAYVYVDIAAPGTEPPAPLAIPSDSDIIATIGQPRASTCRSSRFAAPSSIAFEGRASPLQPGINASGSPPPAVVPNPDA